LYISLSTIKNTEALFYHIKLTKFPPCDDKRIFFLFKWLKHRGVRQCSESNEFCFEKSPKYTKCTSWLDSTHGITVTDSSKYKSNERILLKNQIWRTSDPHLHLNHNLPYTVDYHSESLPCLSRSVSKLKLPPTPSSSMTSSACQENNCRMNWKY